MWIRLLWMLNERNYSQYFQISLKNVYYFRFDTCSLDISLSVYLEWHANENIFSISNLSEKCLLIWIVYLFLNKSLRPFIANATWRKIFSIFPNLVEKCLSLWIFYMFLSTSLRPFIANATWTKTFSIFPHLAETGFLL